MSKSKEATIPLRRAELISPSGVGALTTNSDGINLIPGALDFWFTSTDKLDENSFVIKENRLKNIFRVKDFRLPPDYRKEYNQHQNSNEANLNLTIPMLRFPNYHYCSHCKIMSNRMDIENDSKLACTSCNNKFARLIQVPLIVACENGHLDDFPWVQWVHEDLKPTCKGPLKFMSTGGATLSTMKVVCTSCEMQRGLKGLTTQDSKVLYEGLTKNEQYKCSGRKPWFGNTTEDSNCNCIPQPILKNATNAYYPQILSAIYIPITDQSEITKILELYNQPSINQKINIYKSMTDSTARIVTGLIVDFPENLTEFSSDLLELALNMYFGKTEQEEQPELLNLKIEEYKYLANDAAFKESEKLKVTPEYNRENGDSTLSKFGITKINLIPKLVETRVLYGFKRLHQPPILSKYAETMVAQGKEQLFIHPEKHNWLPAYQVFGEGIYIEFNDELLKQWENTFRLSKRIRKLEERLSNARNNGVVIKEDVTSRYVFLHTLAHLFIQEIVLSCGYSSSSLKERIYYGSDLNGSFMNGFLIYTASGDSEGTMGGLVRLGKTEFVKNILEKVIEKARWCSSDPICNEIGMVKGQGRDYLNGAACHNCTYVSEISCEEFNKYLDRGFIANYEQQEDFKSFFEFISEK